MLMKRIAFLMAAATTATAPILTVHAQTMVMPLPNGRAPTEYYADMPQPDPGDFPANWSPRQNVIDSYRYEQLVRTNPAFRAARVRKECGPVTDPDLFQQCIATFDY